ncbi:cutinase-domain-containing protein [Mycena pura]|uniref:Cutinase-domain-containing protein n=1 Tax=Mycena pura TaxID=153505 RepID=A0AAD6UVM2_9AGAR|nr:cutinase-domain-containing protein [Mycena pura]
MFFSTLIIALVAAIVAVASPVEKRACDAYVIISTRGTTEQQGPSVAFVTMIAETLKAVAGGAELDTATKFIIDTINDGLASCPNQVYALLGYSQGASATVDALKQIPLTSAAGQAVRAVLLVGDPERQPGKKSNVDQNGGSLNDEATGMFGLLPGAGIPSAWDASGKVLDICYLGDGVCSGFAITPQHFLYSGTPTVQTLGAKFLTARL